MEGKDQELADFYDSLFESEARHHTTYVRLAKCFAADDVVKQRLMNCRCWKLRLLRWEMNSRECTVEREITADIEN